MIGQRVWVFLKLVCDWPACGDGRRDPDPGHGVPERGGHVGHQRGLLPNLQSVAVQHHPGTLSIPIDFTSPSGSPRSIPIDLHLSSRSSSPRSVSSLEVVHLDLHLSSLEVVHLDLSPL